VPGDQRKLQQLCAQVARSLSITLNGECDDPVLHDLVVHAVAPAPDAGRLQVTVAAMDPHSDPEMILDHLGRARGVLRNSVAAAIRRHKTPELVFRLALPEHPRDLDED